MWQVSFFPLDDSESLRTEEPMTGVRMGTLANDTGPGMGRKWPEPSTTEDLVGSPVPPTPGLRLLS